jgi:hypothetical protein
VARDLSPFNVAFLLLWRTRRVSLVPTTAIGNVTGKSGRRRGTYSTTSGFATLQQRLESERGGWYPLIWAAENVGLFRDVYVIQLGEILRNGRLGRSQKRLA